MACLALPAHLLVERVAPGHPAAGVDERELAALPLGVDLLAVAGDAGLLLDDRLAAAEDPVHQRRLADVGTTDDGHDGHGSSRCVAGAPGSHDRVRRRRSARRSR